MEPAVVIAIAVLGVFVFIAIIAAIVSAATVSSLESRSDAGENE